MKKILKKEVIIAFIIGIILASSIAVYAATMNAKDVDYKDGKTVEYALNDLYGKISNYTYTNGTNPIPTSTDDSRIVFSSNDSGSPGTQYSAFDRNDNTFWTSSGSETLPQYLGWDFGEGVIVYRFSIKNRTDCIDKNVLNFTLQGYNSNGQWVDIQSYTCTNMNKSGINSFDVSSPKKYSKYRINISSTSPSGTYVQVNQLDFYYLK